MTDLVEDVRLVEEKLAGLAGAIPEDRWDWRPMEGVRSVREVIRHVAADNYLIPTAGGAEIPPSVDIDPTDFGTVRAYEAVGSDKEATLEAMEASFAHLYDAMESVDPAALDEEISLFGRPSTHQKLWILTTTHLHEHLGQMIAYARSLEVTPPWSR